MIAVCFDNCSHPIGGGQLQLFLSLLEVCQLTAATDSHWLIDLPTAWEVYS